MKTINIIAYHHNPEITYENDGSMWVNAEAEDIVFTSNDKGCSGETRTGYNAKLQVLSSTEESYQLNITKV